MKTFLKPMLLFIVVFIFSFLLIVIFLSYFTHTNFFDSNAFNNKLTDLISLLSLSATISAFTSIYFSINEAKNARSNELKQTTIDLFRELRSERFTKVTTHCWAIKTKWDKNESDYKSKLISSMFSEIENLESDIQITKEQIQAIWDLTGFFTILSLYNDNNDDIKKLNYFYYGWWRKFLYELAELRDDRRIRDTFSFEDCRNINFNRNTYVDNVTLKPILQRLDKLCGFENIPESFEFHKSGG